MRNKLSHTDPFGLTLSYFVSILYFKCNKSIPTKKQETTKNQISGGFFIKIKLWYQTVGPVAGILFSSDALFCWTEHKNS
jgi:hypothetical protein